MEKQMELVNLRSPKETWTDRSAVLVWDRPEGEDSIICYSIYVNGQLMDT